MRRRLLYLSRLAPGARHDVFAAICRVSRAHNERTGLSGVLLFDGERFCQMLDGPKDPLAQTWGRITADPRHRNLMVLHYRAHEQPKPPQHAWLCGYCAPDEFDRFEAADGPRGDAAIAAMYDILTRADVLE
jgi:hypothetical protein